MDNQSDELLSHASTIRKRIRDTEESLWRSKFTGRAAGNLVEVDMKGNRDVVDIRISEQLMDDREVLEDLVAGAINDAIQKVDKASKQALEHMLIGLTE